MHSSKRDAAKRVLCYYVKAQTSDERAEIEGIVDDIVDAAVEEATMGRNEATTAEEKGGTSMKVFITWDGAEWERSIEQAEQDIVDYCTNELEYSERVCVQDQHGREYRIVITATLIPGPMPDQQAADYVTEEDDGSAEHKLPPEWVADAICGERQARKENGND